MEPSKLALLLTALIYALFVDTRILYILGLVWVGIALFHFLSPNKFNSTRRKLMIASWDEPKEGVILAKYEADVSKVNEYIKEAREKFGLKVTLTHFVLKVMAETLKEMPDVNGRIVFGKYLPYNRVDISCLVDIEGGKDLAVATVEDADKKSIEDICEYLTEKASRIKSNKDEVHQQQNSTFKLLPSFLIGFMLELIQVIGVDLGISVPALKLKKAMFGCCMVTNIGALGMRDAYAPFTPFCRVPVLITLCETQKKAVVIDDKIEIRPICNINWTVDHRFVDGGRVKKLTGTFDNYFKNPYVLSKLKKDQ
jgi:pyruvate/2-oxoglutarate dehydrogenase complex dihydrolipoamide acyltransferase (E2) component